MTQNLTRLVLLFMVVACSFLKPCLTHKASFPVSLAYRFPTWTGCRSIAGELLDAAWKVREREVFLRRFRPCAKNRKAYWHLSYEQFSHIERKLNLKPSRHNTIFFNEPCHSWVSWVVVVSCLHTKCCFLWHVPPSTKPYSVLGPI